MTSLVDGNKRTETVNVKRNNLENQSDLRHSQKGNCDGFNLKVAMIRYSSDMESWEQSQHVLED